MVSQPRKASPQRVAPSNPGNKRSKESRQPEFEFGGPAGAMAVMVGLPLTILVLFFGCGADYCVRTPQSASELPWRVWHGLTTRAVCSWSAIFVVFGWTLVHFIFYVLLPGPTVSGVQLKDGSRLNYYMNGHLAFWLSLVLCYGVPTFGAGGTVTGVYRLPLSWLYDHYLELIFASMALSTLLSGYAYVSSFVHRQLLAEGGNTGWKVYDFYIGRALNPRIGNLDLKVACELRPGLIGWMVLNMGMAAKQYENDGQISGSMFCVNIFQALYVWDALYNEQAILTTMDVTTDGFGYMLAFGDLTWVPFTYSLQARILVDHDQSLPLWGLAFISLLNCVGFYIFRSANSQKDAFRRNPNDASVAHLKYLETKRGTKLLTSGWWGMARKINYTGDWMMGLAWCLCCGAASPIAYFYAAYFLVLLIHRAARDDHFCTLKYGDDWKQYKKMVPAVFVPGII